MEQKLDFFLSEVAEARNKYFRKYREFRSSKYTRKFTSKVILNNVPISYYSVISNLRPIRWKSKFINSEWIFSLLEDSKNEKYVVIIYKVINLIDNRISTFFYKLAGNATFPHAFKFRKLGLSCTSAGMNYWLPLTPIVCQSVYQRVCHHRVV